MKRTLWPAWAGMSLPLNLDGAHPTISGSIGIALYPEHATDTAALLVHADVAMYTAKQAGSGYAVYDIADDEHSPDHLALPREFRYALAHNELFLQYQPLVDITEGRVTTVEALIRWQHRRHGIIPPSCILPLADRIGVLDALTDWVLDTALAQCRAWHDHGLPLRVAVNTSPCTLQDVTLPDRVAALLLRHKVPPADLTLEITEEALMSDPRQVLSVLVALDKLGVHLAIDDFGTGFSSLAYLRKVPIDTIKIDRSFVRDMAPSMQDEAIVRSLIELGHSLGMHVVAEGIENQETLDRLAELSCDGGQGFYMSQPVAAEAIEAWVSASPWHGPLQES
jgi:EAL domain-containing protein (putative c-di-GMP-specific phosphodiesterase class I)